MTKPMVRIHNQETNEIIDREMTDSEFAEAEALKAERAAKQVEAQAKETARAAILTQLGITEEQAKLFLG
jgi:hypothetical protein